MLVVRAAHQGVRVLRSASHIDSSPMQIKNVNLREDHASEVFQQQVVTVAEAFVTGTVFPSSLMHHTHSSVRYELKWAPVHPKCILVY